MLLRQLQMSLKIHCEVARVRPKRLRYSPDADESAVSVLPPNVDLNWFFFSFFFFDLCPQEAEAFALYHKALDLQKHDKFEESAKAYHELLRTPLLKEVKYLTAYCPLKILMWFCVCGMWHLLNNVKYLPQHTSFSQWGWSLLILHDIKKC